MRGEIISESKESHEDHVRADDLGEQLDSIIGETSSGMGALLSELLRRSLKSGISDIGKSLGLFAEEKAKEAVERQMPRITETANSVAESTSTRVVETATEEWTQKSEKQRQEIETKIQEAETTAIDRSRVHVDEVVSEVRQSINETQAAASQHYEASGQKLRKSGEGTANLEEDQRRIGRVESVL
ncbi:MAG: hypothetical protein R3C05_01345 [Pirellulaceae bacterium]